MIPVMIVEELKPPFIGIQLDRTIIGEINAYMSSRKVGQLSTEEFNELDTVKN